MALTRQQLRQYKRKMRAVQDDLRGTLATSVIIRCEGILGYMAKAQAGDETYRTALYLLINILNEIEGGSLQCGCCDSTRFVKTPAAFCFIFKSDGGTMSIGMPICDECYSLSDSDLMDRCLSNAEVVIGKSKTINPANISSASGRA